MKSWIRPWKQGAHTEDFCSLLSITWGVTTTTSNAASEFRVVNMTTFPSVNSKIGGGRWSKPGVESIYIQEVRVEIRNFPIFSKTQGSRHILQRPKKWGSKLRRICNKLIAWHQLTNQLCALMVRGTILKYRQISNIRRTLTGNKVVDHSDVVGAPPVGAAPTTSSFST